MFAQYYHMLTCKEEDIKDEWLKLKTPEEKDELIGEKYLSPLEFLLNNCYNNKIFKQLTKDAFYFFIHEEVDFLFKEKKICIGSLEKVVQSVSNIDEIKFITEENFFRFQNLIREAYGEKPIKPPEPFDPNEDPRIRRIKEKARERDRIKAKKGGGAGISIQSCLIAICCMGIGITPLNIGELTYASIGPIMKVHQEKEKYDVDIRSVLAGSKKVKPKYWIRNYTD